jgi:hypothetical protein
MKRENTVRILFKKPFAELKDFFHRDVRGKLPDAAGKIGAGCGFKVHGVSPETEKHATLHAIASILQNVTKVNA